jgi:transposase
MARPIKVPSASEDVRLELRRRANGRSSAHRDRIRAKIVLLRLGGMSIEDVAAHLSTSMRTVSIWSSRFEKVGLEGLADKGGWGRKASLPEAKVTRAMTEATRPPKSRSRWSVRSGPPCRHLAQHG